jgi:hypothetical protein
VLETWSRVRSKTVQKAKCNIQIWSLSHFDCSDLVELCGLSHSFFALLRKLSVLLVRFPSLISHLLNCRCNDSCWSVSCTVVICSRLVAACSTMLAIKKCWVIVGKVRRIIQRMLWAVVTWILWCCSYEWWDLVKETCSSGIIVTWIRWWIVSGGSWSCGLSWLGFGDVFVNVEVVQLWCINTTKSSTSRYLPTELQTSTSSNCLSSQVCHLAFKEFTLQIGDQPFCTCRQRTRTALTIE